MHAQRDFRYSQIAGPVSLDEDILRPRTLLSELGAVEGFGFILFTQHLSTLCIVFFC